MSFCGSLMNIATVGFKSFIRKPLVNSYKQFHTSGAVFGWEEFKDPPMKPDEIMSTGRAWTNADLRRKVCFNVFIQLSTHSQSQSFDDLHKLWYVLYKERNVLLSARNKLRTAQKRTTPLEEQRYINVKRSMAAIKHTLDERKKIRNFLQEKELAEQAATVAEEGK